MNLLVIPAIIAKTQDEIDSMLSKVSGKVSRIMVDVMDGKFVPNTSLNFDFTLPLGFEYEAHLMVFNPLKWLKENKDKVDIAILHVETLSDIRVAIDYVKMLEVNVVLALKPETRVDKILQFLKELDGLLIMTADPGNYCVDFLQETLDKIKFIREIDSKLPIEVDGCMNPKNAKLARGAGANQFVSGSYIFKSNNIEQAIKTLQQAVAN